jgi:predicted DNA-binding WGR domain protein
MAFLTHLEAAQNRCRFYVVTVVPELFGDWSVVREWGGIGSPGQVQERIFATEQAAREEERRTIRRRLKRGYVERVANA